MEGSRVRVLARRGLVPTSWCYPPLSLPPGRPLGLRHAFFPLFPPQRKPNPTRMGGHGMILVASYTLRSRITLLWTFVVSHVGFLAKASFFAPCWRKSCARRTTPGIYHHGWLPCEDAPLPRARAPSLLDINRSLPCARAVPRILTSMFVLRAECKTNVQREVTLRIARGKGIKKKCK